MTKGRWFGLALLLLLVLGILLPVGRWWRAATPGFEFEASATAPSTAAARPGESQSVGSVGQAPRSVVEEGPRRGSIEVVCRSSEEDLPAVGVAVFLQPVSASDADRVFLLSDAEGCGTFRDLPAGRYAVAARFLTSGIRRVDLEPGGHAVVELRLTQSIHLTGRVEDEFGRPVGGAAVEVLASEANAAPVPVTVSAADGTFEVEHAPRRCGLGARCAGYDASAFLQIDARAGAHEEVRLVLPTGGASLEGVVEDQAGAPVAGAVVSVGEEVRGYRTVAYPGSGRGVACQRVAVESDEAGHFRVSGLAVGEVLVTARSVDSAPWVERVELQAHERRGLRIRLEQGASCSGVVRDGSGEPLAGIELGSIGEQGSLPQVVRSGSAGRFTLRGLTPGALRLWARHVESGEDATEVQAAAGESIRWDPVLRCGPTLRVRVVDGDGGGLEGLPLWIGPHTRGERAGWWFRHLVTGVDGFAEIANCPPGERIDLTISERVPKRVHLEAIDPTAQAELLVRIPAAEDRTARAVGRVVDAAYRPIADVEIQLVARGSGMVPERCRCEPETGRFETGPVVPGEYAVSVQAPGCVAQRLVWVLRAEAPTELGSVVLTRPGEAVLQGPVLPAGPGSTGGR